MSDSAAPNQSSLARMAVRSTIWMTLGSYGTQVIGFAAMLALTRLLTADAFGYFSLAGFWVGILSLRSKSGLSYAALRQSTLDGNLLGTYYTLDLGLAVLSLVISVVAAFALPAFGYASQVGVATVALMLAENIGALASPLGMAMEKELQLSRLTLVSLASYAIAYALAIGLALSGAGLWSLLAVNICMAAVSVAGTYWICRRRLPEIFRFRWRFDRGLAGTLLRQGISTGLAIMIFSNIVLQFDNFLIGTFVNPATLGFYDRAYRIASWPSVLLTLALSRVGFLTFNKVRDDPARLTHALRLSLWALTTLGIPIALALFFGGPDIVGVLYGAKWAQSGLFLRYLTLYSTLWPFVSLAVSLSVALGHTRITIGLSVTQALLLIVIATPLTFLLQANGTIVGVSVTMASAFTMCCIYMFRQVALTPREVFAAPLIAAAATAAALFGLFSLPGWDALTPLLRLGITGACAIGVFLTVLIALRPAEIMERLKYLRRTF